MLGFGNRKQRPDEQGYNSDYRGGYPPQPTGGYGGGAEEYYSNGYPSYPAASPQQTQAQGMYPQTQQRQGMSGGFGRDPRLEEYINRRTAEIDAQVRDFARKNPGFDIRRELENSKFCTYVWGNGLSIEDAYYLVHRTDGAAAPGRNAEPEKRIAENGTSKPGGSGMVKKNPEDMSDEEIDDIIKRVRKGEKISF